MKVKAISSGDMSGNVESNPVEVSRCDTWAAQFVYSGTPTGTLKVVASNVKDGSYDDLPGGAKPLSGSAGTYTFNHALFAGYKWIKCVYESDSGSGTLDCYVTGKERR